MVNLSLNDQVKLQPNMIIGNRTPSYDKRYLGHTDTTGAGTGRSYPHKKDFAWDRVFLKKSWQSTSPSKEIKSTRGSKRVSGRKLQSRLSDPGVQKQSSNLPPVGNGTFTQTKSRMRSVQSLKSRPSLDSIPEDKPVSLTSRAETKVEKPTYHKSQERTRSQFSGVSPLKSSRSRNASRRAGAESGMSSISATSSLKSSNLPSVPSTKQSSYRNSAVSSRSSYRASRAHSNSSRSTRWDEHEGRPKFEKAHKQNQSISDSRGNSAVPMTLNPETMKKLLKSAARDSHASQKIHSRESARHMDSVGVKSSFYGDFFMPRHQPFTNLTLTVQNAANQARLRTALHKSEKSSIVPTIFKGGNDTPRKDFNPKYHGEITRPVMVNYHDHKKSGAPPSKWKITNKGNGQWTVYD